LAQGPEHGIQHRLTHINVAAEQNRIVHDEAVRSAPARRSIPVGQRALAGLHLDHYAPHLDIDPGQPKFGRVFMRHTMCIGLFLAALVSQAHGQANPAANETGPTFSSTEMRELLDAAKATAKATRENVDYIRVVPDMLHQIQVKLDKLEDKLDKIENAIKRDQAARPRSR
jgi:hypothetical protein